MLGLARSRVPADRERLLMAVIDLCDHADPSEAIEAQGVLREIFMSLVVEAERDLRQRLAERLATAAWAPHALINILALDDIEIARPIIASSPVLKDQDLIRLLVEATLEHQVEVAKRPQIGSTVVDAILAQSHPDVLAALAGNETAEVGVAQLTRLVAASRRIAALRAPLSRHPKLTVDLAYALYVWVGDTLRHSIASRFRIDEDALHSVIEDVVKDAHAGAPSKADRLTTPEREGEREEMERRLVAKLASVGQLRPGYLLRALREGKLNLFIAALATLGDFPFDVLRRAVNSDRAEYLALACAAVGIDRSVFPSLLALVRDLNYGLPGGNSGDSVLAINHAFSRGREAADQTFRQLTHKI
jgi:uncharacterized protein (DUF2336 family)